MNYRWLSRSVGIVVLLGGFGLLLVAIWALIFAGESARMLGSMVEEFDPVQWLLHWRTASIVVLAFSIALVVSAFGFLRHHRWAPLVLGFSLLTLLTLEVGIHVTGLAQYSFEDLELAETTAILIASALAFLAYGKWRRSA